MEKRRQPRHRRGIQCEIRSLTTRATGVVENVSARGMFVKTAAHLQPRGVVEILINDCGVDGGLRFEAGVARSHTGSRRFESQSTAGIGFQVIPPWTPFERWVHRPALPPLEASACIDAAMEMNRPVLARLWKVQLVSRDRKRGRVLTLECETAEQAQAFAGRKAGTDWTVRSVNEI